MAMVSRSRLVSLGHSVLVGQMVLINLGQWVGYLTNQVNKVGNFWSVGHSPLDGCNLSVPTSMSLVSGSHSQDSLLVLVSQSRLVSLGWSNGFDRSRPVGWSSRSIGLSLDRSVDWSVLGTLWKKKHYMIYVLREEVLFGKCIVQANMRMLRCMPIPVKQHRYIIELSIENLKLLSTVKFSIGHLLGK